MRRVAILLGLAATGLAAQDAAFEGTAVNSVTGAALSGVHVSLLGLGLEGVENVWGAVSDGTGRFSITGLPAGKYIVKGRQTGFVFFPPKRRFPPADMVDLQPGQRISDFRLVMAPEGWISGRVVDENGDPVAGVSVTLDSATNDTLPVSETGMSPSTDDRGAFRLPAAPGGYYVRASAINVGPIPGMYGVNFYPGVTEQYRSKVVTVEAGREISGIEIRLISNQTFSISGSVEGLTTAEVRSTIAVHLKSTINNLATSRSARDANFHFTGLQRGTYELYAEAGAGSSRLCSSVGRLQIQGGDISGLRLRLQPMGPITGMIDVIGQSSPMGSRERAVYLGWVGETLNPYQGWRAVATSASTFMIDNLIPGRYRVVVEQLSENEYIQAVELDGRAVDWERLDLTSGGSSWALHITVSVNGARVSGKVLGRDGRPGTSGLPQVFCVPVGERIDTTKLPPGQLGADASYEFHALRAGKYKVFAVDAFQFGGVIGQELLERIAGLAEVVELKDGDRLVQDLKQISRESVDATRK